ncbi:MAG: WD40 repeat domain-containing protein [Planctomycetota bacterium]
MAIQRVALLASLALGARFAAFAEQPADAPLPTGAIARLGSTTWQHPGGAFGLAFSPDGSLLASSGGDGQVRVWDLNTGQQTLKVGTADRSTRVVGFLPGPGGARLAVTDGSTLRILESETGKESLALPAADPSDPSIYATALSADASLLAAVDRSNVQVWETATGAKRVGLSIQNVIVCAMAISPDGKRIATGASSMGAALWNAASGRQLVDLPGYGVSALDFSPDGKLLAVGSEDEGAFLWDPATHREVLKLEIAEKQRWSMKFSRDGSLLAVSGGGGQTVLWDVARRRRFGRLPGGGAAFSPDGKTLATCEGVRIRIWDLSNGKEINAAPSPVSPITCLAPSPDGALLAVGEGDGSLRVWETATRRQTRVMPAHRGGVTSIAFSPDGSTLATGGWDGVIVVREASSGKETFRLEGAWRGTQGMAFSRAGDALIWGGQDGLVRVWEPAKGKGVLNLAGQRGEGPSIAATPDRAVLFSTGHGSLSAWGLDSRRVLHSWPSRFASLLAIDSDGSLLAAAGDYTQPVIRIWETASGNEVQVVPAPPGRMALCLALSPDSRTLAASGDEPEVILWDVVTKGQRRLEGHEGAVRCLAFEPSGRWLASGSDDATVLLWKMEPTTAGAADAATDKEFDALWEGLAGADAGRAQASMRRLEGLGGAAVAFMRSRLPQAPPEASTVTDLVVRLGDDDPTVRDTATRELERLGTWVLPSLREAAARSAGEEARARIRTIIEATTCPLPIPPGERLRAWRAALVLERMGTEKARSLRRSMPTWPSLAGMPEPSEAPPPSRVSRRRPPEIALWDRPDSCGDRLPRGAVARLGTARFRDGTGTLGVDFGTDGTTLATGNGTGAVRIWEASTGSLVRTLWTDAGSITKLAVSPDGKRLAVCGQGGAFLYDLSSGTMTRALGGHEGAVFHVAFSPDGSRLATAGDDATARIWEADTGREVVRLQGHSGRLFCVAFSPDGARIATSAYDGSVRTWEAATGKELSMIAYGEWPCCALAFLPGSSALVTCDPDGKVRVWDGATGQASAELGPGEDPVCSLACAPDGGAIVTVDRDGRVVLWDVEQRKERWRFAEGPDGISWFSVALSADGKTVARGGTDGIVLLLDARSGLPICEARGHMAPVHSIDFSPDGGRLASGSEDCTARIWNVADGRETLELRGEGGSVRAVAFSPEGKMLLTSSRYGERLKTWDATTGQSREDSLPVRGSVSSLAFSPDGGLAVGTWSGISLWQMGNATAIWNSSGHDEGVSSLAFLPDGKSIVIGHASRGRCALLDAATGREVRFFEVEGTTVRCVAVSPDSLCVALVDGTGTVRLWETATARGLGVLGDREPAAMCVRFSPDGAILATGDSDGVLRLWEAASGRVLAALPGHRGPILAIRFSPDGRTAATAGSDTSVLLWDLAGILAGGPQDLTATWEALGGEDAMSAQRAVWSLANGGDRSVAFLRERLASGRPDGARVEALVAALESDDVAARERAFVELGACRGVADDRLRAALAAAESEDLRARLGALLEGPSYPLLSVPCETLRKVRAVNALGRIGGEAATEALREMTAAAPSSREAACAAAALQRRDR